MIDEKKLIEAITKGEYTTGNIFADMELQQFIKDFPKISTWIPTSERKPDETGFYLVTIRGAKASTELEYIKSLDSWIEYDYENHCFGDEYDVIAWQPLPEPYKGVEE